MKDIKKEFIEELCKCNSVSGNALKIALILMDQIFTQKEICDKYNYKKSAVSMSIQKLWEMGIIEKKQIHSSDVYYSNLSWKHNGFKLLEWNINGRSNKNYMIPEFVSKEIINRNADVVIINEFSSVDPLFLEKLANAGYYYLYNEIRTDKNKILIAIKSKMTDSNYRDNVVENMVNESKKTEPNFLQVKVDYNATQLTIIGTRIRDGNEEFKKDQFEVLKNHLETINGKVFCAGDFNVWSSYIKREWSLESKGYNIFTPPYTGGYKDPDTWSHIGKDKLSSKTHKSLIDHIVSKDLRVSNLEYIWEFVTDNNGYGSLEPGDYKSDMVCYPDHAILTATIEI